jgi:hypothetical protein
MTKNDFAPYKYDPKDLYGTKIGKTSAYQNKNLTKIVANGIMKNSTSLMYQNNKERETAYRSKPAKSRLGLLQSDIKFGDKNFTKKSRYTEFCDSLSKKNQHPRFSSLSRRREFNIISNQPKRDGGMSHYGFDRHDSNRNAHTSKTGNFSSIPPNKGRFFLY